MAVEFRTIQKVWKAHNTYCICIPKNISEALGLTKDDKIQVNWEKVIKGQKKEEKALPEF